MSWCGRIFSLILILHEWMRERPTGLLFQASQVQTCSPPLFLTAQFLPVQLSTPPLRLAISPDLHLYPTRPPLTLSLHPSLPLHPASIRSLGPLRWPQAAPGVHTHTHHRGQKNNFHPWLTLGSPAHTHSGSDHLTYAHKHN